MLRRGHPTAIGTMRGEQLSVKTAVALLLRFRRKAPKPPNEGEFNDQDPRRDDHHGEGCGHLDRGRVELTELTVTITEPEKLSLGKLRGLASAAPPEKLFEEVVE